MTTPGQDLKSLFGELVALEPAARAQRLAEIEQADPELRDALVGLLAADQNADSLLGRLDPATTRFDPYGLSGRTLAHFQVGEVLGAGGMGVVYRARDVRLGREVALKLLPPHLGLDPDARRRFLREARAAAALDHPNIATVFEVGEAEGGRLFHAAALYRGESLRQRLARGPLSTAEGCDIATQVLSGLAHAHAAGVVHRDLKPENLIVTPEGVVKIVDFGLATLPGTTTASTMYAGTAGYAAPEQLCGETVDARADLWALGVVLYEMLTGQRPFQAESPLGIAQRMLTERPARPSSLRPGVPAQLDDLVERLLQRDPQARPASAQAALDGLDAAGRAPRPATGATSRSVGAFAKLSARLRRHARLSAGIGVAVLLGMAVLFGVWRAAVRTRTTGIRSIAVLPFENLSPESTSAYMGDGIAEQVLDELGRIDGVRTVARTSSFAFRGKSLDARKIGRQLGVAAVLEGSVASSGNRIRVWVELVSTADGYRMWSERYDRPRMDILTLQDDIAGAIATALAARLRRPGSAEPHARPVNLAAYDLYIEGRNLWYQRTPEALVRAAATFEQALALDSTYALAYAGLADVYAMLGSFEYAVSPPAEAYERARAAARKALELDAGLGAARAALANVAMNYDRDWPRAEREFQLALRLSPGYAPAHQWYAFLLVAEGRNEEALRHLEKAGELDPLSPLMAAARAQYFYFRRQYDQSRRALNVALRLDPAFERAHLIESLVDVQTGQLGSAVARLTRLRAADPGDPVTAAVLAYAFARTGEIARARELGGWLAARSRQRYVPPELRAVAHIGLGEREQALHEIEQAFRERSGGVLYLPVDPLLDPLRAEPRFQELLRRLPG